ncbi:hypothetical protein Zmor_017494 [Zophobas morio]|uniref:Uncharacterized protein n=1 Tax=Zophobas morio TaxID=2755281 RepID=A0AA38I9R1_9CUCU|nr:hypothetical protein Zmor_017494 [Zophobas morio]
MVNFSNSNCVDMVMFYGVADGNARLVRELWIERFPNQRMQRILQAEEQILQRVEEEPDISTLRLAAEVEVSQFIVHRTLK